MLELRASLGDISKICWPSCRVYATNYHTRVHEIECIRSEGKRFVHIIELRSDADQPFEDGAFGKNARVLSHAAINARDDVSTSYITFRKSC